MKGSVKIRVVEPLEEPRRPAGEDGVDRSPQRQLAERRSQLASDGAASRHEVAAEGPALLLVRHEVRPAQRSR